MKQMKMFYFLFSLALYACAHLKNNKPQCDVSRISLPAGIKAPILTYSARVRNDDMSLTALNRLDLDKYEVKGNIFYSDKTTGDNWYSEIPMDESTYDAMKDSFDLCKILNLNLRKSFTIEDDASNKDYEKFKTQDLPLNVSLRVS